MGGCVKSTHVCERVCVGVCTCGHETVCVNVCGCACVIGCTCGDCVCESGCACAHEIVCVCVRVLRGWVGGVWGYGVYECV